MWSTKLLFIGIAPFGFLASSWHPFFAALLVIATIWAISFQKARSEVFAELYRLHPYPMRYFSKSYEYIRYLEFKKIIEANSLTEKIEGALTFVDTLHTPNPRPPILTHPLITLLLGGVLAILGGGAGQWPMRYVVGGIIALIFIVYFTCMILDVMQTPTSDLNEFRRFLQWTSE
ncbi:hypothetical protein SD235_19785 (plasmid) [Burkholderia cepacia]|uniref:hypothetical protein n=1 Tax=Burkholderia cepacia TaxID=292 RepID=UPI003A4DFA3E